MDGLIPWQQPEERIPSFRPKAGKGRRPYPPAVMLRIHCMQLVYSLSDPEMEAPNYRHLRESSLAQAWTRLLGQPSVWAWRSNQRHRLPRRRQDDRHHLPKPPVPVSLAVQRSALAARRPA